jgi:UDP-N-acetyl-2-amino-2-deoxyglucuronate dehydrogenase
LKFAIVGAAGYVAPRHLRAIQAVGGELVAALDPHDSVGILDSYNRGTEFFTEPERFDRFLWKHRGNIDFVTICSPNHLHDVHCRMALRIGADAICEKPLVLRPWNADELIALEKDTGSRVHPILQMRLHPAFQALRDHVRGRQHVNVRVVYVAPRGNWYRSSWKSDPLKSGGVAMNIGIHIFDLLGWVFGIPHKIEVNNLEWDHGDGVVRFKNATVEWTLSTRPKDLPQNHDGPYRVFHVDDEALDVSTGFEDLHTQVYRAALAGDSPHTTDAKLGIEIVCQINTKGGVW